MIGPLDRSQLHLVRGGGAANAGHVPPRPSPKRPATLSMLARGPAPEPAPDADARSPLARNVESLVLDAYQAGLEHGEQQHYRAGWRMGLMSGLLPGAVSGGAMVYLVLWLGGLL